MTTERGTFIEKDNLPKKKAIKAKFMNFFNEKVFKEKLKVRYTQNIL